MIVIPDYINIYLFSSIFDYLFIYLFFFIYVTDLISYFYLVNLENDKVIKMETTLDCQSTRMRQPNGPNCKSVKDGIGAIFSQCKFRANLSCEINTDT